MPTTKTPTRSRVVAQLERIVGHARETARLAEQVLQEHPADCDCACCDNEDLRDVLADLTGLRWVCETAASMLDGAVAPGHG